MYAGFDKFVGRLWKPEKNEKKNIYILGGGGETYQ
jgi:hypothetical protein